MWGPYTARYLIKKSKLLEGLPSRVQEKTTDNITAAKQIDKTDVQNISERAATLYRSFADVVLEPYQCNVPGHQDVHQAIRTMWGEIQRTIAKLGNPLLDDDLWEAAKARCREAPCRHDHKHAIDGVI